MGGDLKIQQLCDKLNRDIHSPLFLPLLKSKGNGSHERAFTSLDVIEDTQDAIEEFDALSEVNSGQVNKKGIIKYVRTNL